MRRRRASGDGEHFLERAPDAQVVVVLHALDAGVLERSVLHVHVGREVVVERRVVLFVEPADVLAEPRLAHAEPLLL